MSVTTKWFQKRVREQREEMKKKKKRNKKTSSFVDGAKNTLIVYWAGR